MARDPKNFTGENIPALLAAEKERERVKGEWSLLGHTSLVLALLVLFAAGLISLLGS